MSLTTRTEPAHCRQVAWSLTFGYTLAPFVDWAEIGKRALELKANVDARHLPNGCLIVELWWPVDADETMAAELDQADVKAACEKLGVKY